MPGIDGGTVCLFGVGGPVGAVAIRELKDAYRLRLCDLRPPGEILQKSQSSIWPRPDPVQPPHEWRQVDVTDYAQVEEAMRGCDAVINLTVNRGQLDLAFRVNVIGAFNVMKAAAVCRPKRVVHTGPVPVAGLFYEGDYRYEFNIPDEAPLRPGTQLYPITKYLALRVVDAFAARTELDVITLLVSRLRPHDQRDGRDDDVVIPFSVSWEDLGRVFPCALRAPQMPRPNEVFYICTRLPMGKYSPDKAARLLGWEPRHRFERFWQRADGDRSGDER